VIVTLDERQVARARREGARRQANHGRGSHHRWNGDARLGSSARAVNEDAAGAELAVSIASGQPWTGEGGKARKGDVGPYEVRNTVTGRALLVHPDEGGLYIGTSGRLPTYVLHGLAILPQDAKREHWAEPPRVHHPCFLIPHDSLRPLSFAPASTRPRGAFADLPAGGCYLCHDLIWDSTDLLHDKAPDGTLLRRHRQPCYSEEVPW
jgi:hypothetical protein